jgi:outer membrane protein assembly factor BamD
MGVAEERRVRRLSGVLAASLLVLSCAHTGDVDLATLTSNSDEAIYEAGLKASKKREWEAARKHFKRIIDGFPQSQYGGPARLGLADTHFNEGGTANYILAVSEYRDFLQLFPTKPDSPYAQFQVGEAYYHQKNSPDRDQGPTVRALEEFQLLLERYPNSKYVEQARQRVVVCRQSLGRAEYLAGFFYEHSRRAYHAAVVRYEGVVRDYPDYDQLDLVLYRLGLCLTLQGRGAEALPVLARLSENYPKSIYLAPAQLVAERAKKAAPAVPSPPPPSLSAPPETVVAPPVTGAPTTPGAAPAPATGDAGRPEPVAPPDPSGPPPPISPSPGPTPSPSPGGRA